MGRRALRGRYYAVFTINENELLPSTAPASAINVLNGALIPAILTTASNTG